MNSVLVTKCYLQLLCTYISVLNIFVRRKIAKMYEIVRFWILRILCKMCVYCLCKDYVTLEIFYSGHFNQKPR
jgi:hypothetical protein